MRAAPLTTAMRIDFVRTWRGCRDSFCYGELVLAVSGRIPYVLVGESPGSASRDAYGASRGGRVPLRKTERSSGGARGPRGEFCRALIGWPLPAARESLLSSSCSAARFSPHRVQRLGVSGKLRSKSADVRGKSRRVLLHSTARTTIPPQHITTFSPAPKHIISAISRAKIFSRTSSTVL